MSQQSSDELLRNVATIENLIERAEFRAKDAAAAIDEGAANRMAHQLRQLKARLAELKQELATRTIMQIVV